jgi:hypothetical protein
MDTFTILTVAGATINGIGFLGAATGRFSPRSMTALLGASSSAMTIVKIYEGDTPWAVFHGGVAAFFIYSWWNNGGGDDTKRRLKSAAKKFQPTRRTAPDGGAA